MRLLCSLAETTSDVTAWRRFFRMSQLGTDGPKFDSLTEVASDVIAWYRYLCGDGPGCDRLAEMVSDVTA